MQSTKEDFKSQPFHTAFTKGLSELNRGSLPQAGGKGANLGELIQAGLPVPTGFVITTSAYCAHLEALGLQRRILDRVMGLKEDGFTDLSEASSDILSWIVEAPMPIKLQEEVSDAYERLSEKAGSLVSVRSSATAEDLQEASFAGQHDTYLGVSGKESVLMHVKKCWASLWSAQAISYRISQGFDHLDIKLAVVVQAMIASQAAGVMFTANPINGDKNEMLIEAGPGLGESVVSGLITPDTFILSKTGAVKSKTLGSKETQIILKENGTATIKTPKPKQKAFCIGQNELMQLANLANAVEKHYESPMDTEWALLNGKIYLLQARPITTMNDTSDYLNILMPNDKIIYGRKKSSFIVKMAMDMFSEPATPLDFSYLYMRYQASMSVMKGMGMKLPKTPVMPVERESGCVAISLKSPSISPAVLWKMPLFLFQGSSEDVEALWQPVSEEMRAWLKNKEALIKSMGGPVESARLTEQSMEEFGGLFQKRFVAFFKSGKAADSSLSKMVKKAVGKEDLEDVKEKLFRALPFRTALQNQALASAAQTASSYGKESEIFIDEFAKFMDEYGDRPALSSAAVIGSPTWRECPEYALSLIDALMNAKGSLKEQQPEYEEARKQVLGKLSASEASKFIKTLEKARNAVLVREESSFLTEKLTACIRRMALKLGETLKENSLINEAGDVFFVFLEELKSVASGELDIKAKIEKRKEAYAKVYAAHEKGIHWMVSTGSFPDFEAGKKNSTKGSSDTIHGASASRGVYEGPVCLIKSPSEFGKLKKGDVLASAYTSPAWTPLFKVASAVVTERGSAGSHAAIVSREYGIPCVVAIPNIMNVLKDGQIIRVDGNKGDVTILNKGHS